MNSLSHFLSMILDSNLEYTQLVFILSICAFPKLTFIQNSHMNNKLSNMHPYSLHSNNSVYVLLPTNTSLAVRNRNQGLKIVAL